MHLTALSACYELKGDWSLVMLKEIFHHSLKISKFTRNCTQNHVSARSSQSVKIGTNQVIFID